ncbi:MAG TPA: hypothetical protein VGN72_02040 [Tepidisphaeraceae bacterium]|jgi:hypothetical protein|nr:hypothetical protein [Tepidisphaeraceae bacterium]
MKRELLVLGGLMLATIAGGCEGLGSYDGKAAVERNKRQTAKVGAPAVGYHEVTHEGRIYVVSSDKVAADVRKGMHPPTTITKVGMGPNRETVIFEANKFYVEDELQAEYAKRHPKK